MQPDLIARIEAAQPSEARELFHEALFATFDWTPSDPTRLRIAQLIYARSYLDAAAMFVPEGWNWMAGNRNQPVGRAWVANGAPSFVGFGTQRNPARKWYEVVATTPYFALLAAAMKARQSDEQ